MLLLWHWPKVITLRGLHCNYIMKVKMYKTGIIELVGWWHLYLTSFKSELRLSFATSAARWTSLSADSSLNSSHCLSIPETLSWKLVKSPDTSGTILFMDSWTFSYFLCHFFNSVWKVLCFSCCTLNASKSFTLVLKWLRTVSWSVYSDLMMFGLIDVDLAKIDSQVPKP